jgi:Multicopper oxidase
VDRHTVCPRVSRLVLNCIRLTCTRYVTDNPGAWVLHCHVQWHLVVSTDYQEILKRPFHRLFANLCLERHGSRPGRRRRQATGVAQLHEYFDYEAKVSQLPCHDKQCRYESVNIQHSSMCDCYFLPRFLCIHGSRIYLGRAIPFRTGQLT